MFCITFSVVSKNQLLALSLPLPLALSRQYISSYILLDLGSIYISHWHWHISHYNFSMYQPLAPPHLSLCIDIYIYVYHIYLCLTSNKNNCFLFPPLSLHWYLSPDRPLGTNHQLFGGQYDAKICQRISLSLSIVFLHKIHPSKW